VKHGTAPSGFTLVEVLIALAIMALLVLLTNSAFFSMSRSSTALSEQAVLTSDLRLLAGFLDSELAHVKPLAHREQDELKVYFAGFSDRVRFTGTLPAHRGGGGLHFLELDLSDPQQSLVIAVTPAANGSVFSGAAGAWERTVLSEDVRAMRLTYFGAKKNTVAGWHDDWVDQPSLPELIKLQLELDDGRDWPPLVIALHTTSVANQPNLVWQ
jgi:general secretion pathway protein J